MELFTKIDIPSSNYEIDYKSRLMFIGSCFAENISRQFSERKFHTLVNPLGIIYNPLSIENLVQKIAQFPSTTEQGANPYTDADVFFDGNSWSSWDAHGSLSTRQGDNGQRECVSNLNSAIENSFRFLQKANFVFITFGTAFVYFLKETGKVVSNCHKQNANLFERRLISVEQATQALRNIVTSLRSINKDASIVFTVSPLRHLNDGAHGNNLSKSTLLLAVENVCQEYSATSQVSYFPSYEIVIDELRDYRFYKDDMVHLSETAEDFIFEKMRDAFCSEGTKEQMKLVEKFMKTVNHRIQDASSERTAELARRQIEKATELEKKIAGLDLGLEKNYFSATPTRIHSDTMDSTSRLA